MIFGISWAIWSESMIRIIAVPRFKSIPALGVSFLGPENLPARPALGETSSKYRGHNRYFDKEKAKKVDRIAPCTLLSARILLIKTLMMYRVFVCIAWIASALSVQAAVKLDFLTVGSTTYSNVTVFGANATDLFFTSDQGVSNVKLKFLSPELQKEFNYNPTNGDKAEQQQIADDKRFQDDLAASIMAGIHAARQATAAETQAPYAEAGLSDPVSADSPIGKAAPQLNFDKWVGSKPDITGKLAIISAWSPKSASCRKWIPLLNDLHKTFAGKLEVVGVTTATEADVEQADPKADFSSAIDPAGKFLSEAHITTLPCVMLVDTNGLVRYLGHPAAVTTNTLQTLFQSGAE
jgi:hypothetical protein